MLWSVARSKGTDKHTLALQRLTSGDVAGAIVLFQELLEARPDDPGAWDDIGWAVSESHPAEAIRYFDRALELDPCRANAWIGRGMAVGSLPGKDGQHEALRCFQQARTLDPACANAWFLEGSTLEQLGRTKEGAQARRRASELDPNMFGPVR